MVAKRMKQAMLKVALAPPPNPMGPSLTLPSLVSAYPSSGTRLSLPWAAAGARTLLFFEGYPGPGDFVLVYTVQELPAGDGTVACQ